MPPLTLLYLINEFADGSVNTLILSLIEHLDPEHYSFHVLGLKAVGGPLEAAFREAGATVVNLGLHSWVGLGLVRQLSHYIHDNHIQIVHTHVLRPDILGGIAARLSDRAAVISTKHNPSYVRQQQAWLLRNIVYWPVMYLPDHIVTVTELIRQQAISHLHISPDRISTIHNGIEVDRFYKPEKRAATRAELGLQPDDIAITYTGRLIEGKGLPDLLPAFQRSATERPNIRLVLVGNGPIEAQLRAQAHGLGIESNVIFTGFRTDIPELLAAADIFVLPSFIEGLPLAMLEAMAACKPVIAAISGGVPEVVTNGQTGLLVEPGDVAGLMAAINSLADSPGRRQQIAEQGRQHVVTNFSVDHMIAQHDTLYRTMAARTTTAQV